MHPMIIVAMKWAIPIVAGVSLYRSLKDENVRRGYTTTPAIAMYAIILLGVMLKPDFLVYLGGIPILGGLFGAVANAVWAITFPVLTAYYVAGAAPVFIILVGRLLGRTLWTTLLTVPYIGPKIAESRWAK